SASTGCRGHSPSGSVARDWVSTSCRRPRAGTADGRGPPTTAPARGRHSTSSCRRPAKESSDVATLLVVEDEPHIASGLRFNLEAEGHDVAIVDTGEAALDEVEARGDALDGIVLDVMLPGIDGFEVASTLRARGRFLPILMLTARGRAEDVLKGFAAGADDYLPKPFDLAILV